MKRLLLLFALVAVATSAVVALTANASDHADSPSVVGGDRAADFSDVYAFRSPENSDNLVVALNVNGILPPEELANFATDITTEIHVDTNADLADDATVTVTFPAELRTFKVEGLGDPITGEVTPPGSASPKVTEADGIKVFAGPRADPFFQDIALFGFLAEPYVPAIGFRRAGDPPVVDYLANFPPSNVSSIVIELPITKLTGAASSSAGTIKVWASTSRGGSQIDRMAIPDNNNFLMPAGQHDAFNHGSPATDAANFRAIAQSSIEAVRARVDPVLGTPQDGGPLGDLTAEQAAAALIPDVLTIDFSQPVQFPNGRRLQDDESDFEVGVLLNRGGAAGMPDGVTYDAITSPPLLTSFPYLAAPFVAAAPTVSGAPNTGTGGPTHGDSSNMLLWLVLAGSLAGIALLGSGFVLRRTSN